MEWLAADREGEETDRQEGNFTFKSFRSLRPEKVWLLPVCLVMARLILPSGRKRTRIKVYFVL